MKPRYKVGDIVMYIWKGNVATVGRIIKIVDTEKNNLYGDNIPHQTVTLHTGDIFWIGWAGEEVLNDGYVYWFHREERQLNAESYRR